MHLLSFFNNLKQKNPKQSQKKSVAKIGKAHISTLYSFIFLHKNVNFWHWPYFSLFWHGITQLGIVNLQLSMKYTTWDKNRPGIAGAHSTSQWSVSSQSSSLSQTVKAKEQIFWENVHPLPCVICHVSCVTCHISHVTCHIWCVTFVLVSFFLLVELFGGGSVINGAYLV